MTMDTLRQFLVLNLIAVILMGCVSKETPDLSQIPEKRDDGWSVGSAEQFTMNTALLDTMSLHIETGQYVDIHSVLVAKDGVLVLEEYFNENDQDTLHEIRSATKSIGSMLTGIAIDQGFLSSESEPIFRFFEDYEPAPGWTAQAKKVEIRHLISMMSGYECDDLATNFACENAMYRTNDWVQFSLDLPFAFPPGEHWAYNSASLILVSEVITRTSGFKVDAFADRFLFEPLGIERFRWQISPRGQAWIGGGARMVPREMAKIGQLMLNRGLWNGKRLLSEEWINKSTVKQGEMMGGVDYGYLWQRGETYIGQESVTAYWASGNGGQYIIVLPDHGMVVVFTGGNYDSPLAEQPFRMLTRNILPAFLNPEPLVAVELSKPDMEKCAGVYRLTFEPSATSTISIHDGRIQLLSPESETIDLVPHTPRFFTGVSQYGPITVVFDADDQGNLVAHRIHGSFQTFVFERE